MKGRDADNTSGKTGYNRLKKKGKSWCDLREEHRAKYRPRPEVEQQETKEANHD